MLAFDHLKLLTGDPQELLRFCLTLRTAPRGQLALLDIWHEADDSCCALEPWPQTFARLLATCLKDKKVLLFRS